MFDLGVGAFTKQYGDKQKKIVMGGLFVILMGMELLINKL
jgi:hypothetical protein